MNSPALIRFSNFIKIDKNAQDAIYLQIVYQFINAVKNGKLMEGQKLPGTRIIAADLGLHRRTIVASMEELKTQDWIETRPSSGTFVKNPEWITHTRSEISTNRYQKNRPISFGTNYILETSEPTVEYGSYFTDGLPDYRIIKANELARFYSGVLNRKFSDRNQSHFVKERNLFYRQQLCNYLKSTESLSLNPRQLLCSNSRENILNICSQMLVKNGDIVLVAELSYFFANMIFRQVGADVRTLPMDEDGILTDYIKNHFSRGEIRLLYLSTKYQYPTSRSMSSKRRRALLTLADELDFVIVEDATDAEISFDSWSGFSLFKEDVAGRILYLGALGRFLMPGFQSYFLAAPDYVINEAQKYLQFFGNTDFFKDQALGEMIYEGDLHRYRRKVLKVYKERRDEFARLLERYLQEEISFELPNGGLAFWVNVKKEISLVKWSNACMANGLYIPKFCLYQDQKRRALRLGFAHLNSEEMRLALQLLKAGLSDAVDKNLFQR